MQAQYHASIANAAAFCANPESAHGKHLAAVMGEATVLMAVFSECLPQQFLACQSISMLDMSTQMPPQAFEKLKVAFLLPLQKACHWLEDSSGMRPIHVAQTVCMHFAADLRPFPSHAWLCYIFLYNWNGSCKLAHAQRFGRSFFSFSSQQTGNHGLALNFCHQHLPYSGSCFMLAIVSEFSNVIRIHALPVGVQEAD